MDAMTGKSHGGFINFVNNGALSWKSGLQSIVTLSSCEAEYVMLRSAVCEVKYLRSLMRELGHKQAESTLNTYLGRQQSDNSHFSCGE